jgi:hypothetical protein
MARMRDRILHPEFFTDAKLYDAEKESGLPLRLAYEGLWCAADREGRFEWKPRELKLAILPYDNVDFGEVMQILVNYGFVAHYSSEGVECGWVRRFGKWQNVHPREAKSRLPEPVTVTEEVPVTPRSSTEVQGKAGPRQVIPGVSTSISTSVSTSTSDVVAASATNGGKSAKHPRPSRDPPPAPANWVNEAVQIHETHIGVIAHGKLGKLLKPLVDKRRWENVKPVWEYFCEFSPVQEYLARVESGTVREGEQPVRKYDYKTSPQFFVEHFTALAHEMTT